MKGEITLALIILILTVITGGLIAFNDGRQVMHNTDVGLFSDPPILYPTEVTGNFLLHKNLG